MTVELFLGGARSGKSSFAEQQALQYYQGNERTGQLHYVATATPFDEEMTQRIIHHQQRRGSEWKNHEAPLALARQLRQFKQHDIVLVDCLTLWINNVIYNQGEPITEKQISGQVAELITELETSSATILCVSNEVGLGIVPMGQVSRLFVDHAGWMNQAIAQIAQRVVFMAAGLPMYLKGSGAQ